MTSKSIQEIRRQFPNRVTLGTSTHSVASSIHATQLGIDYLQVGTMFPTASHPEKMQNHIEGPDLLREIKKSFKELKFCEYPKLFAVGGIDASKVAQVIQNGADGIAVISYILGHFDPAQAVRNLRHELDRERNW